MIMATALGNLEDKVNGLNAGADSYMVKPVELEELLAVVRRLAQRLERSHAKPIPHWLIDCIHWLLIAPNGDTLKLTNSEVVLLGAVAKCPGQHVARDIIIRALGHNPKTYDSGRLKILAQRLRNKVSDNLSLTLPLETVHGLGYAFTAKISLV